MITNNLSLNSENNIILAQDVHSCILCAKSLSKELHLHPEEALKRVRGQITGQAAIKITRMYGEDLVICQECAQNALEAIKAFNNK